MSEIDILLKNYEDFVRLPWDRALAGPQKVWFAIYDPSQERRLRFRIPDFEVATKKAGHSWEHKDLTDAFGQWMAQHDYREEYFQSPDDLDLALPDYAKWLASEVKVLLDAPQIDGKTVVALSGVGSLFGLMRVSVLIEDIAPFIKGRLLVFFPGHREGSNYRLLDARDGWNYLAVPITSTKGD